MNAKKIILAFLMIGVYPIVCYENLGDGIFIKRNCRNNKPKIAILTVIIGSKLAYSDESEKYGDYTYENIVSFGTKSKELYAKKYGYDFIIATNRLNTCYGIAATRPLEAAWTKIALVSRFLDKYDWVFWTDADSIILNFNTKLENFIDNKFDLIACMETTRFTEPYAFKGGCVINTGQVLYKNSEISKKIILETWKDHHKITPGSYEQARLNNVINKQKLGKHVKVYPGTAFNLKPELYKPGNFLVHMYSYHGKYLYDIFKKFEQSYKHILDAEEHKLKTQLLLRFFCQECKYKDITFGMNAHDLLNSEDHEHLPKINLLSV